MSRTKKYLVISFLLASFLISFELHLTTGSWFDISDVHHETWIIVFLILGMWTLIIFPNDSEKKKGM
jgi:hypothetical protein